jgi:hypothetical protein
MSNPILTREEEITADLLNEKILYAASDVDTELIAPEETLSTAEVVTWNESPETLGLRIPEMPPTPEISIAEQLVTAGVEEAEIEKRAASTLTQ